SSQEYQGRYTAERHSSGLIIPHACGRVCNAAVFRQTLVFDVAAQFDAGVREYAVADLELRDGAANRFHMARHLASQNWLSWFREPEHQRRDWPEAARHVLRARPPIPG